ncbi:RluA family pseudouridine synthase [Candidatus Gromoviella agglomerans]|uniref:RluA family pseudouridine synthase n=1 Tax=Candidatus Gromoviella agglomerans TaxID=2806609 RepID=UPI001E519E00|nr:RluA family pseudouridine synthase [Candidatus Gromoviella agglomerans]UFX98248.1 RluA family pseudouridine synthase [Candidatus Gromoviella agglomerans]
MKFLIHKCNNISKILRWIKSHYSFIPQSEIFRAIREKDILINGKKCKFSSIVNENDEISLYSGLVNKFYDSNEKKTANTIKNTHRYFDKLYENDNIIVVNKKSGISTQGGTNIKLSLVEVISQSIGKRAYITHRLDKDTSGVIIFAKNAEYASLISKEFRERRVFKKYQAIIHGNVRKNSITIQTIMQKISGKWGELMISRSIDDTNFTQDLDSPLTDGQIAITKLEVIERLNKEKETYTRVNLFPITGRKHQLRSHMLFINHPILGDKKYYDEKNTSRNERMLLHCCEISFSSISFDEMSRFTAEAEF